MTLSFRYSIKRLSATLGLTVFALGFASPMALAADNCCKCTLPADPQKNICIKTQIADCSKLSSETKYPAVKNLNCTTSDSICKPVAESGTCVVGPIEENNYNLAKNSEKNKKEEVYPVDPPDLNIAIPGLTFAKDLVAKDGYLEIPFLAQYISAIYSYLLIIAVLAAGTMIVYGGFKYIVGGTVQAVNDGRTIITDAVIGLLLIISASLILRTINPALTTFNALKISRVPPSDWEYFDQAGTADAHYSSLANDNAEIPEGSAPPLPPGEFVSINDIPFDRSIGGPAMLDRYCTKGEEARSAVTVQQKAKMLARAVLGFNKVCVSSGLCAYCQACSTTIPDGAISGGASPSYGVARVLVPNGLMTPEQIWDKPSLSKCVRVFNNQEEVVVKSGKNEYHTSGPFAVDLIPECRMPAVLSYAMKVMQPMQTQKYYGSDCYGTMNAILSCGGLQDCSNPNIACKKAKMNPLPKRPVWSQTAQKYIMATFLDAKNFAEIKKENPPGLVLAAYMNEDVNALANIKGGLKFGDIVYINRVDQAAAHWFLYTGGRPDVPFSFIEMGPGSAYIPGVGSLGGVRSSPATWTLQSYVNTKIKPQPPWSQSGKIEPDKKKWVPAKIKDPRKGFVFVWRTLVDDDVLTASSTAAEEDTTETEDTTSND